VTYHRLHPTARILILEAAASIGGTWAPHRIFPGLKTNNLWGTYQNPDYPMDEEKFGVEKGKHLPAEKVVQYFQAFAEEGGVSDCFKLNTKVEIIEQIQEGWQLHCVSTTPDANTPMFAINTAKLILSVGNTNQPSMPKFPNSPSFSPPIIHSKDFPRQFTNIVRPNTHTLVVGAGKSAWDVAYACANQPGSTATMLIRPSGNGPVYMSPTHVTPLGLWLEKVVFTRFFGFFSPCPWAETRGFEGWVRWLLHQTWLGRKTVGAFWGILGDDNLALNKLLDHPETAKLRPWRNAFETGNALSITNYPTNFFDLVKSGKVKIVIDEIENLGEGKEVLLKSGEKMDVDAIVCATGWKVGSTFKFKPEGLEKELGFPTSSHLDIDDAALVKKVESDLYSDFRFLKERDSSRRFHPDPALRSIEGKDNKQQYPYRLYRFLVPASDFHRRSISIAGALMSLGNASCAYLQSLWLTAYLDGTLELPTTPSEELKYETYRETQYCALRNTMGFGNKYPDLVFDSLPYFDLLMQDLGFDGKRKGSTLGLKNWGAECFRSYGPEDYKGLIEDWERRTEERDGKDKKNV
jgi:hypothetical protein